MKTINIDDELYRYIASQTEYIGENASEILRRLLKLPQSSAVIFTSPNIVAQLAQDPLNPPEQMSIVVDQSTLLSLLKSNEYKAEKKTIRRFMQILSLLYQVNAEQFSIAAESLKGRKRLYFAKQQENLLANGEHTKPQMIPDTPYWVITNTNTARKKMILEQIMLAMKITPKIIEYMKSSF